jgi:hypothetical protein
MEPPPTHELVLQQVWFEKKIELYNAILPQQTCYNSSTFSPSLEAYSASSHFTSARTLSYWQDLLVSIDGYPFYAWVEWGNPCKVPFPRTQRRTATARIRTLNLSFKVPSTFTTKLPKPMPIHWWFISSTYQVKIFVAYFLSISRMWHFIPF